MILYVVIHITGGIDEYQGTFASYQGANNYIKDKCEDGLYVRSHFQILKETVRP